MPTKDAAANMIIVMMIMFLPRVFAASGPSSSFRRATTAAFCRPRSTIRAYSSHHYQFPNKLVVLRKDRRQWPSRSFVQMSTTSSSTVGEPLPASKLRWKCDPDQFHFKTTADLEDLRKGTLIGQARAESAVEFGVNMRKPGYNLYILGPSGSGKRTLIRNYLEEASLDEPPASDWAYVHNFDDPDHPRAIRLPAGLGTHLRDDLEQLVEDVKVAIPAALESEEHQRRIQEAKEEAFQEQQKALEKLDEEARKHDVAVLRTPRGYVLGGPVSSREGDSDSSSSSNNNGEMQFIPPEKKRELAAAIEKFQPKLEEILNKFPQLRKKAVQRVKELNKEAAKNAIEFLFLPLKTRYEDIPGVVSHLDAVEANAIERSEDIHSENEDEDESLMAVMMKPRNRPVPYERYNINLIVDNNETLSTGAPVIYEENPLYYNLIGRTEHLSQFGAYLTDFSLIKAGSLHRANGGYLVLNARDVLIQPFSWEALKRCLRTGAIKIESLGAEYGFISTVTLQPEPIKLDVKVALVGDRLLYYLLCELDPDFNELFKVAADFNDEMDRSPEACQLFAQMMATLAKEKELKPLDKEAVAAMIEQAARQVGDQEKLSTHMRSCTDLLCESDYWARMDDASVVGSQHVRKAIDQQIYRADRIRALIYEQIRRGIMLVDVKGSHVGQVNGLSVMTLGSLMFGRPSRITATARLGRGKVVDIEREVELGGALHSKGVMILSSFLSSHYALDCPLCVSANLVFEQSYGMIEGDSASMAELCALLSTLADVPVRQDFAITGSVNQFGQAQAIGGVTEKIEGFYDVCVAVGLTGDQAVLVPESNVPHLMLRPDVLEAVDQGKFSVYTYSTVNEAMKLLTGKEAGERGADGSYPPDTINHLVDERLHEFAELTRKFSSEGGSDSEEKINGEA